MVSIWGLGCPATLGGGRAPGLWMLGGAERLLEARRARRAAPDLAACNAYQRRHSPPRRRSRCPATLILGERDMMTPAKGGRALARRMPGARRP